MALGMNLTPPARRRPDVETVHPKSSYGSEDEVLADIRLQRAAVAELVAIELHWNDGTAAVRAAMRGCLESAKQTHSVDADTGEMVRAVFTEDARAERRAHFNRLEDIRHENLADLREWQAAFKEKKTAEATLKQMETSLKSFRKPKPAKPEPARKPITQGSLFDAL